MLFMLLFLAGQTASAEQGYSSAVQAAIAQRAAPEQGELAKRLATLAAGGDLSAAEALGEITLRGGFGIAANPAAACDWFERASVARGDSTHNLALCFETGNGRTPDLARARTLYEKAAGQGWVQAKCALGTMLIAGRGGTGDVPRGLALCREAAEAGNANAQTDYANYLLLGEVTPKDAVAARRWYTAAAEQNQANAAFVLAQIYSYGDGTSVDPAAADYWWRVAYANGRADAAAFLAQAAFHRAITTHDGKKMVDRAYVPEAIHWVEIAAREDPDPKRRAEFSEILETLRGN